MAWMKVTVLETDGVEVTRMLIENPAGIRTADIRYCRFGHIFIMATASTDEMRIQEFSFKTPDRIPGAQGGRIRI